MDTERAYWEVGEKITHTLQAVLFGDTEYMKTYWTKLQIHSSNHLNTFEELKVFKADSVQPSNKQILERTEVTHWEKLNNLLTDKAYTSFALTG